MPDSSFAGPGMVEDGDMGRLQAVAIALLASSGLPLFMTSSAFEKMTLNPRAFGAKCDGFDDDTAALQATFRAVSERGDTVVLPPGTCVIHSTVYLKSHTHVVGNSSTLLAETAWTTNDNQSYSMLENVHGDVETIADEDISVHNLTFDYGSLATIVTPSGGKHALRLDHVRNVIVQDNLFLLRGAEDAVAGIGVEHMRVVSNAAYDFRNCAYDFWSQPHDVEVTDNYAETSASAQMVNFNPERSKGESTGLIAQGFHMSRNTLIATGPKAVPIQVEPLGTDTMVRDVVIDHNRLHNAYLVLRGNVSHVLAESNVIVNVLGGASAFETYPHWNGVANHVSFSKNTIVVQQTGAPQVSAIRLEANNSEVSQNVIVASATSSPPIFAGKFDVVLEGNEVRR